MAENTPWALEAVQIPAGMAVLDGDLIIPSSPSGTVVLAHGGGSSRHSARNRHVARVLNKAGFATLLMDLLTVDEEVVDALTSHLRFDIPFLAERLIAATDWLAGHPQMGRQPLGYFGASTGAAIALFAAARRPDSVEAIVSRGGRPDLAGPALSAVRAPTLLIVGGNDPQVLELNRGAFARLCCEKRLEVIPGASHLLEEPRALETAAQLARDWFRQHLVEASRNAAWRHDRKS